MWLPRVSTAFVPNGMQVTFEEAVSAFISTSAAALVYGFRYAGKEMGMRKKLAEAACANIARFNQLRHFDAEKGAAIYLDHAQLWDSACSLTAVPGGRELWRLYDDVSLYCKQNFTPLDTAGEAIRLEVLINQASALQAFEDLGEVSCNP